MFTSSVAGMFALIMVHSNILAMLATDGLVQTHFTRPLLQLSLTGLSSLIQECSPTIMLAEGMVAPSAVWDTS